MAGSRGVPPDFKNALSSIIRNTVEQVKPLADAAVRQAQTQKSWLDATLLGRKRRDALAELGEIVFQRIAIGDLGELAEDESIARLVGDVVELDEQIANGGASGAATEPARWDRSERTSGAHREDSDIRDHLKEVGFSASDWSDEEDLAEYMNDDDVPERG